ncbi:MAG: redoxin domain-containing protein [Bryobacteraceae bacterium]
MAATPTPQEVGCIVDDFRLPGIDGEQHTLNSYMEGRKGAVVLFWSGVCAHCVRYDGFLNEFAARYPDLALIGIASRTAETPDHIRKTIAERKLDFPILLDAGSVIAKRWYTQQTPRVFLIDAKRTLLYRGAIDNFKYPGDPEHAAYLEAAIAEFLGGKPVSRKETASFGCAIYTVYYDIPLKL